MRGRAVSAAVLAVGLCVLAGTAAPAAHAYTGSPQAVLLDPANWPTTYGKFAGTTPLTSSNPATQLAVGRAAVTATAAPSLGLLGTIGVGASGLAAGYAIGTALDRYFSISCHIGGFCGDNTGETAGAYTVNGVRWSYYPTGVPFVSWLTSVDTQCATECYLFRTDLVGIAESDYWSGNHGSGAMPAIEAKLATVGLGTVYHGGYGCGNPDCVWLSATPSEMEGAIDRTPISGTSPGGSVTNLASFNPTMPDETDSEAIDAVDELCTDIDICVEVAMEVDPAYEGLAPEEFTMPDCEGLTYAACLALLEDEGYVGSITTNELGIDDAVLALGGGAVTTTNPAAGVGAVALDDPITFNVNPDPLPLELQAQLLNETAAAYLERIGFAGEVTYVELPVETSDPALGPTAPVRVTAPAPTSGTRTIPVPYPGGTAPPERIPNEATTEITVTTNSPDMPPADEGSTCVTTDIGAIDPTPITELDYGDKFPFGVFPWVSDQLAAFDVSPVAPNWTIPVLGPDGWTADYDIDLDPFSPYMQTMRTVLAWILWVGSLWFIAATFLGFRSSGNPADAVDDYLDNVI